MKDDKLGILVVGADIVGGGASKFLSEVRRHGKLAERVIVIETPPVTPPFTPPDAMRLPFEDKPDGILPAKMEVTDFKTTPRGRGRQQARMYARSTPFEKVPLAEVRVRTKRKKRRDKKAQLARRAEKIGNAWKDDAVAEVDDGGKRVRTGTTTGIF